MDYHTLANILCLALDEIFFYDDGNEIYDIYSACAQVLTILTIIAASRRLFRPGKVRLLEEIELGAQRTAFDMSIDRDQNMEYISTAPRLVNALSKLTFVVWLVLAPVVLVWKWAWALGLLESEEGLRQRTPVTLVIILISAHVGVLSGLVAMGLYISTLVFMLRWLTATKWSVVSWQREVEATLLMHEVGDGKKVPEMHPVIDSLNSAHDRLTTTVDSMNYCLSFPLVAFMGSLIVNAMGGFLTGDLGFALSGLSFPLCFDFFLLFSISSIGDAYAEARTRLMKPKHIACLNEAFREHDGGQIMLHYFTQLDVGFKVFPGVMATTPKVITLLGSFILGVLFTFGPSLVEGA